MRSRGPFHGRIISTQDRYLVQVTNAYDFLDRVTAREVLGSSQDPTGLETFGYDARGLERYVDQLGHPTTFGRDALGRVLQETNANGEVLGFSYNPSGELLTLTDGKSQVTAWAYDGFGRVTNKVEAGSSLFSYQYDPLNRLTNRVSAARGPTVYRYDPLGNLTNVDYSGGTVSTPSISFAYDPLNRLTTMADGIGTTAFTWTPGDQLASETGPFDEDEISYVYTNRLRASLSLLQPNAAAWVQNYSYQSMMRPQYLTSPAGTFLYNFYPPSATARPDMISLPNGGTINNLYDDFARILQSTFNSAVLGTVDQRVYGYDAASQVTQQTFLNGNFMNYGYDNIGQLTTAQGFEAGGTPARLQEQFGYAYDKAWNLSYRTNNFLLETFAVNSLNELSSVNRSGSLTVAGTSTSPASTVNVSGTGISGSQAASIYADSTWALGGVTPANGQNTFTATATDSYNRTSQASTTVNLPASSTFTYDANGNLLGDGTRSFAYDDENQLTSVWVTNAWRSDFVYDGLMRRRIRKEFTWSGGAWVQTNEVHYVCDGNLVIQERYFDPQISMEIPNDLVTYTRGNDLSSSLQGAGGIGGLLARSDSALLIAGSPSAHSYYGSDANGNITCMINESNMVVARYVYDPFGKVILKSGTLADENLYRFSSKECHLNSDLAYYGYRYYDPDAQRWINADPIQESGGINLYEFVVENPNGYIDPQGLTIYLCTRTTDWGVGRHAYLWDDRSKIPAKYRRSCGEEYSCSSGKTFGPTDVGPIQGVTTSLPESVQYQPIPGSQGHEDEIMNYARHHINDQIFWWPGLDPNGSGGNDCHAAAVRAIQHFPYLTVPPHLRWNPGDKQRLLQGAADSISYEMAHNPSFGF